MSRAGKPRTSPSRARQQAVPAHGGNLRALALAAGLDSDDILDFSANINPLGLPEWLRPVVSSSLAALSHYPDPDNTALVEAAAHRYGAKTTEIVCGNGSTEILYLLPRALQIKCAIVPVPSYADYATAAEQAGAVVTRLPLREDQSFMLDVKGLDTLLKERKSAAPAAVLIGRPNNPTGGVCDGDALRKLAAKHPSAFFIIDEAFADFAESFDSLTRKRPANVIVLCSLTKTFCVPGLRIGVAVADARLVRRVRAIQPPWSVNTLAQAVGAAALKDAQYVSHTRMFVSERRAELQEALRSLPGLTVFPGCANYLLVRLDTKDFDAAELARRLLKRGIAIRLCANFAGLDERYFRVAVRTAAENERLAGALRRTAGVSPASAVAWASRPCSRTTARTLMFQGTSSDAGKSVLTAAFCRILLQDGFRVAPFKSQNMSLNSFVTRDGGEMGRAQVVQAQACRIEPDVRMNPILLKPNSDTGSQVIVRGKPVGNMNVGQYIRYKPEAFRAAQAAFDSLAADYDVVVLEGAGSPGEVNLKRHDIVNMGMARYANAPVLLVGDIDRGGVFASFVGTMEVLAEWERALVAGFIVNRFRGKESLLGDALDYTLRHTGKPVLGVVPYLRELGLPEEDSVSFKNGAFDNSGTGDACVEIAVVDLPHISNFTDFDALRIEPDVRVRIVRSAADINSPDAIVLPGSKNVIGDIEHLRRSGLAVKIMDAVAAGRCEVVGICGGFQILGEKIADPHHIESKGDAVGGLGLLPLRTTMALGKTLTRADAKHLPSGLPVRGYEIHHGQTDCLRAQPVVRREDGEVLGAGLPSGLVWGTYLHGTFDADEFRRWFIDRLRVRKGLKPLGQIAARYDLEPALDRLADVVRRSVKMDAIYKLLGVR